MFPTFLKAFVHPHSVYKLEYPAHWDQVTEKDGESCGFGPHERDDVGLWISIMPMSVDTDKLEKELPNIMQAALEKTEAANLRRDTSLRHFGLVADMKKEGQGGHYWMLTGGDTILFASTQVPTAERDEWNPIFLQMMASLQITREDELVFRKVANEVMAQLRLRLPDQDFQFEANKIRGKNRVVFLGNVYRDVRDAPDRREQIIKRFVDTLSQPAAAEFGQELWDDARGRILPVLKPQNYVHPDSPTEHLLTREWLADVLVCYAILNNKTFRFVTGWDVNRWGTNADDLDKHALDNLARQPWPKQLMGARFKNEGQVIVVDTDDSLASSRLLHPDLHKLFSSALGSPFWAGIPCRNRLVLYSDRKALKQRIGRRVRKDHDSSSYQITPNSFLVTRDGIAPGLTK
jgi:uncharacterized protein YtpQ (UPF0354 family)